MNPPIEPFKPILPEQPTKTIEAKIDLETKISYKNDSEFNIDKIVSYLPNGKTVDDLIFEFNNSYDGGFKISYLDIAPNHNYKYLQKQYEKEIEGYAGKMLVYEALYKTYLQQNVTYDAWLSEKNKLKKKLAELKKRDYD